MNDSQAPDPQAPDPQEPVPQTPSPRREARELVLMCLHQWDQREPEEGQTLAETLIQRRASQEDVAAYARKLLTCFWDNTKAVDACIAGAAENWRIERMAVVDRSVLRLAATELLYMPNVPPKVSIDEAIELAKKFSTEMSGAFVNGILDRIRIELEKAHGSR